MDMLKKLIEQRNAVSVANAGALSAARGTMAPPNVLTPLFAGQPAGPVLRNIPSSPQANPNFKPFDPITAQVDYGLSGPPALSSSLPENTVTAGQPAGQPSLDPNIENFMKLLQKYNEDREAAMGKHQQYSQQGQTAFDEAAKVGEQIQNLPKAKKLGGPNLKQIGVGALLAVLASLMGDDGSFAKGMIQGYMGDHAQRQAELDQERAEQLERLKELQKMLFGKADYFTGLAKDSLSEASLAQQGGMGVLREKGDYEQSVQNANTRRDIEKATAVGAATTRATNMFNDAIGKATTPEEVRAAADRAKAYLKATGLEVDPELVIPEDMVRVGAETVAQRAKIKQRRDSFTVRHGDAMKFLSGPQASRTVGTIIYNRLLQDFPDMMGESDAAVLTSAINKLKEETPDEKFKAIRNYVAGHTADANIRRAYESLARLRAYAASGSKGAGKGNAGGLPKGFASVFNSSIGLLKFLSGTVSSNNSTYDQREAAKMALPFVLDSLKTISGKSDYTKSLVPVWDKLRAMPPEQLNSVASQIAQEVSPKLGMVGSKK